MKLLAPPASGRLKIVPKATGLICCALSFIISLHLISTESAAQSSSARSHKINNGDLALELLMDQGDGKNEIHLKITSKKSANSSVFVLENPSRIVIDLVGPAAHKNSELGINNTLVSGVRIGAHKDKSRIVVDVVGKSLPPYRWSESKTTALLRINYSAKDSDLDLPPVSATALPDSKAESANEEGSHDALPSATSSATPAQDSLEAEADALLDEIVPRSPAPTNTAAPTAIHTIEPTATPAPAVVETAHPTNSSDHVDTVVNSKDNALRENVVKEGPAAETATASVKSQDIATDEVGALEFGYSGDFKVTPTIKIKLGSKSEFELKKIDDKTYSLQIPKTRLLRPALKLPQFPPHDFVGFNMVLLKQFDNGVEVTIGVERGIRISVAPNGDEIWIKIIGESKTLTQSPPSLKQSGK